MVLKIMLWLTAHAVGVLVESAYALNWLLGVTWEDFMDDVLQRMKERQRGRKLRRLSTRQATLIRGFWCTALGQEYGDRAAALWQL